MCVHAHVGKCDVDLLVEISKYCKCGQHIWPFTRVFKDARPNVVALVSVSCPVLGETPSVGPREDGISSMAAHALSYAVCPI